MMALELRVDTIAPTGPLFDGLARKIFIAIQRTQNLYAGQVYQRARHYPPERAGQQYKRTSPPRLGGGWHITPSRLLGDTQEVIIYNNAVDANRKRPKEYAGYVYGFDLNGRGQSIWHQGRWPTQGALLSGASYQQQVQSAINQVVSGGG